MVNIQQIIGALTAIVMALSTQVTNLSQSINPRSQLAAVAPTSGLVGYWNFNEGSGTIASDSSGSSNNGTLNGGATWGAGKYGSAVQLDGVNDFVDLGLSATDLKPFTASFWVFPKGSGGHMISKRDSSCSGVWRTSYANGAMNYFTSGTTNVSADTGSGAIPLNTWSHITISSDGTLNSTGIKIFLNGNEINYTTPRVAGTGTVGSNAGCSLRFGSRAGTTEFFKGDVDELRVYSRALSNQEVLDIYNDTGSSTPPPPSSDTTPPTVPSSLSATAQSSSQINLTWSASTDNVGVTGYKIFRNGSQVGTSGSASYNDSGLSASTQYSYTVSAYDAASNNSSQSSSVSATTQATAVPPPSTSATISINPNTTYQTMKGWEAASYSSQDSPYFSNFSNTLFDQAINDLGINRVRLEIKSGAENTTDFWTQQSSGQITSATWRCVRYSQVNDNPDPNVINPAGFQFSELDNNIDKIIVPLRQKLQAKGENLYINVNYVSFTSQITGSGCPSNLAFFHNTNPAEYAEFVLATYQHMQSKYGFVPDSWEVVLEPDNNTVWTASQMGAVIAATAQRLQQAGFSPKFVAPSTTSGPLAASWLNTIASTPGVTPYLSEASYHRYVNIDNTNLTNLKNVAAQYGIKPAMLEWIGATYATLHNDLKVGNNSSWQQFVLGGTVSNDDGGKYYIVNLTNPQSPTISMGGRTKFLRQYFKYIRSGAVRIEAASSNISFDPVAFRNTNGGYVVVVKATAAGSFSVGNLPTGTYGIFYTTGDGITASQYDVNLSDISITSGQSLTTDIPAQGVITIYAKTGGTPPPVDTTAPIISSVVSSGVTQNSTTVSWSTNENSDTQVEYGPTTSYGQSTSLNSSLVASHSVALSGLTANTTYNYRVKSRDAAGNLAVSSNQTFTSSATTLALPVISSFSASPTSITSGQSSTLSWTVTGATSLSINQNIGTVTGTSRSVSPTVTATYTLTATNAQGSVTANTTVTVNATQPPVSGNVFYVAPNGSASGNGSISSPWDIKTLNANKASVPAGSTVYLRGGVYKGLTSINLAGTAAAPIKVRSYPGEWAVFDSYDNSIQITSALGGNSTNRTVTVNDGSKIIQGAAYMIENEQVQVGGISGNTLTLNRGWGGSTVSAHPIGAQIKTFGGNTFSAGGQYVWYMDFEVMSSDPVRQTNIAGSNPSDIHRAQGVFVSGDNVKLINLVVHDTVNGIFTPDFQNNIEVNGVITYSNGWWAPDRGHGHGMYLRNGSGTLHKYNDVISFDNYATGQKVFGYDAHGEDVHFDGFVGFNNEEGNFLMGVSTYPMKNLAVRNSYIYSPSNSSGRNGGGGMRFGYGSQDLDIAIENNYIAGRTYNVDLGPFQTAKVTGNTMFCASSSVSCTLVKITPGSGTTFANYTVDNNIYFDNDQRASSGHTYNFGYNGLGPNTFGGGSYNYNLDWKRLTPYDTNSSYTLGTAYGIPNVDKYFVRPNAYELGRGNIVVYNWSQANSVSVNVSSVGLAVGDAYEVKDVQNYLGSPIVTGVYNGSNITIPMTSTAMYPAIGNLFFVPTHTSKEFGVFVIRKKGGSTVIPPPTVVDTTPPTVPTNILANVLSSSAINLSWTRSTDSVGVVGYKIYRGGVQIATSPTNSYSDTGLSLATTYNYSVSAYDLAGNNSAQSLGVITATSPISDSTPPVISSIQTSGTTSSSTVITWTTNEPATSKVNYGLTTTYNLASQFESTLKVSHSVKVTGLKRNTTYHFQVVSMDGSGNISSSADLIFKTSQRISKIPTVSTLTATNGPVVLNWQSPKDPDGSNYELWRGTLIMKSTSDFIKTPNAANALIDLAAPKSNFADTNVVAGKTYYYSVFAYDDLGNYSDPVLISFTPTIRSNTTTSSGSGRVITENVVNSIPNSIPTPSGLVASKIERNLYIGTKGADVLVLQQFLINKGYLAGDANTGYFGLLTQKAVKNYQKEQGIVSTGNDVSTGYGVVGPLTKILINNQLNNTTNVVPVGTTVNQKQIQDQINQLLLLVAELTKKLKELQ